MKNLFYLLFVLPLLFSCGGTVDNGSWSGETTIAGITFDVELETMEDETYIFKGSIGGISFNDKGKFKKNSDTEIKLLDGEFAGDKFIKEGSSMKWYNDDGDYVMELN